MATKLWRKEAEPLKMKLWNPQNSYKLTLKEIAEQQTPAGIYRHKLQTTNKDDRKLRRLEWRWQRRLAKWIKATTIVQAAYRGMVGRGYFKSIKRGLELKKIQREAKINAVTAFNSGDKEKTIEILSMVEEMSGELYIVQAKVYYILEKLDMCILAAQNALSTSIFSQQLDVSLIFTKLESAELELDSRFILATCYVKQNNYGAAFDELNLLSIAGDTRPDTLRLRAYVASLMSPPNYDEAILVMTVLINDYPEDLNLVSHYFGVVSQTLNHICFLLYVAASPSLYLFQSTRFYRCSC
jgi:tetratricopeptide (TPR) repeat protein